MSCAFSKHHWVSLAFFGGVIAVSLVLMIGASPDLLDFRCCCWLKLEGKSQVRIIPTRALA
jgi:hypothetical protein